MSEALLELAIPRWRITGEPAPFFPALLDVEPRLLIVGVAPPPGVEDLLTLTTLGLASRDAAPMSTLALRFRPPRLSLKPDLWSMGVGGIEAGGGMM